MYIEQCPECKKHLAKLRIVKGCESNNTIGGYEVEFECLYFHYTQSIGYRLLNEDLNEDDFDLIEIGFSHNNDSDGDGNGQGGHDVSGGGGSVGHYG